MPARPQKTVADIVRDLGRYSLDAFDFLHGGLDYTVQKLHGPRDPVLRKLVEWMEENGINLDDLEPMMASEDIPPPIEAAIEHFGGSESLRQKLNRHVTGAELCWGLRDFALNQWGLMAPAVLRSWGIRSTKDFGRMVFALVDNGLLQKQPGDRIGDFVDIYDFDKAFNGAYKITMSKSGFDSIAE